MIQAFHTGISGIKTSQYGIDVVSDNLANIDTYGFKGYVAEYSSLFEDRLNTSYGNASSIKSSIGVGSKVNTVAMDESGGVLMKTERSTDLALLDEGWFGIQKGSDTIYTRDGNFVFDVNRDLVTQDGYFVLGTLGENIKDGVLVEKLAEIELKSADKQQKLTLPQELSFPLVPTDKANFLGNIGTEDTTMVISAQALDSQGNKNAIRLEFSKSDPQVLPGSQWDIKATAQSSEYESVYIPESDETIIMPKEIYDTRLGKVSFDHTGALISTTLTSINNNGTEVAINLGSMYEGIVSSSGSVATSSSSNGKEAGDLLGYDINGTGQIVAAFSNGEQSSVGSVAVFHFANDRGLARLSGTRFIESSNSGEPLIYKNADGKNTIGTQISNYRIEGSNVRMEAGLTELIILQRTFDANSKSITTADEMIQKAINMTK